MAIPVFVLLHGAWHTPRCWSLLIPHLTDAGYEAVAPALPSSGSNPPTPDWSADVTLIRETVSSLVDQDRDVVVVMHSFSGMTGGTALEGLDKASRTAQGLGGGVVRLIYLVAFIVAEGFQHSPYGTRDGMVPQMQTDFEAGVITILPEDAKDMFHQDVDDKTVAELAKELQPQSLGAYWSKTTYAAWRVIPTTYIVCTKDVPTTVDAARLFVGMAQENKPNKIDKVIDMETGHCPFISKPEPTAEALIAESNRPYFEGS